MSDLDIFRDEFVPNIEGHSRLSFVTWMKTAPADYDRWVAYRDALLAGSAPSAPVMSTKYGKALVAAGKLITWEAPPQAGSVVWRADGTTGTDPAYILEEEWSAISDDSAGGSAPISAPWTHPDIYLTSGTGDVLPGKRSYFVHTPIGEGRHEIKMAHPLRDGFDSRIFHEGEETWVSWAVTISDFTTTGEWWIINQFRHVGETGLSTTASPHALTIRAGDDTWYWTSDSGEYTDAIESYDMGVPIVEDQVLKVTFHAKWSYTPSVGFMEVFLNNGSGWVTGFPKHYQQTLLFNETTQLPGRNHMRFGCYRDDTSIASDSYMAGLVCASTRAKAEREAFGA